MKKKGSDPPTPDREGSVRSKSTQSLGWIDTLLGDKKARRKAELKAAERRKLLGG